MGSIKNIPTVEFAELVKELIKQGLKFESHYNGDRTYTVELTGGY